jgi:hypothetical protein
LKDLRAQIHREVPYIGIKPFFHNIVRLTLAQIELEHGMAEANKAVRDFNLAAKGFSEEIEEDDEEGDEEPESE